MSPADIVEKARRCGVSVELNNARTGLSLSADSAPVQEICGGHWLADKSVIMVCCGADYGDVHEACWEAWEAEQDRRARRALGFE